MKLCTGSAGKVPIWKVYLIIENVKAFYYDNFTLPLPPDHRFPVPKYPGLRQRLLETGILQAADLQSPDPATIEQLTLAHNSEYIQKVLSGNLTEKESRRIGFPWSRGLVERSLRSVGATIAVCRTALQEGVATSLAGGTHHAFSDHGEGFCVFNDVAVAVRVMQQEGRIQKAVVLDLDVHQGNGTASIFAGDPSVFTFSLHGQKNFPFHKEKSDLDIALPDWTADDEYLTAAEKGTREALHACSADMAVFLAGADPYVDDRLGRMCVSKTGLSARDRMVFDQCWRAGLPVAVVMSGGYAKDVNDIVDIHSETIRLAAEIWHDYASYRIERNDLLVEPNTKQHMR